MEKLHAPGNMPPLKIGKIDKQQAQKIIDLFIAGRSEQDLAEQFNVGYSNVRLILRGDTWKGCVRPDNMTKLISKNSPINQETAQQIIDEYCLGVSTYDLADKYNLWQTSICNLIAGRSWPQCCRPDNIKELIIERHEKGLLQLGRKCHIDAPPFTSPQLDIIIGSLLGDGSLRKEYANASFSKSQAKKRLEYLEWMQEILVPYSNRIDKKYSKEKLIGGKGGVIIERRKVKKHLAGYALRTHQHPEFTKLWHQWYKDKIKIVPTDLELNPLRIATWFWDDGSNNYDQRMAIFCTQSFTIEEAEFLANKLHGFDIRPKVRTVLSQYTGRKMPILKIYSRSYDNLIQLIKPYMLWPCFEHKIRWREALNNQTRKPISEWNRHSGALTEKDVMSILKMNKTKSQQEIAKQFGVAQTTISAIITGKTWKHLDI